jgi:spermidine synthase
MSHVFLEQRDGALRLYLGGDLQFDSRDERQYHEPLALVPTALARGRRPGRDLRVLVLGGGDGLALREVLRWPEVREVHLVDRDPEVLRLGSTTLAGLNRGAFGDPRVRVHVRDARDYLPRARAFDVLISDLTYPGDLGGAALFAVAAFRQAGAALRPGGVLAVNAVSPDETPEAFGCVAATLAAAGLPAVPYAFRLPSFAEEGYGRWGFFFASAWPIGRRELGRLAFPEPTALTAGALLDGTRLPAAAARLMRVAPNETHELLYYVYNATALAWTEPRRPLRLGGAGSRRGPRLTVAEGFARWLRAPAGRRSLEELLACLPMSWRGQTREALIEWSYHAEILFREMDLRAFVERILRRSAELPRGWIRELRLLRERLRVGLPAMGELLHVAFRVFAIYLLTLLLVNLFFPDNLYAKGWSSSGSRSYSSGSGSGGDPFFGFNFSDPGSRYATYRFRPAFAGGRVTPVTARAAGTPPPDRVYDPEGRSYPALRFTFTDPQGGRKPVGPVLALTPELQLLETGVIGCAPALPGYQCLLEPGRVRVLDAAGREVMSCRPPARLLSDARSRTRLQVAAIDRALADHRRWLEWVEWGKVVGLAGGAASELGALEAIKQALGTATETWDREWRAGEVPTWEPAPAWVSVFPGLYLEPARFVGQDPTLVWAEADGTVQRQSVVPPATLAERDRFLFRVLHHRLTQGRDQSLSVPVTRWIQLHGAALDVPGAAPPTAGPRG